MLYIKFFLVCVIVVPYNDKDDNTDLGFLQRLPKTEAIGLDEEVFEIAKDLDYATFGAPYYLNGLTSLRWYFRNGLSLPPSADRFRFPSTEVCWAKYDFARTIRDNVWQVLVHEATHWSIEDRQHTQEIYNQICKRVQIWRDLVTAVDLDFCSCARRDALGRLRISIGYEAYYNGPIPSSVPFELFREKP